MISEKLSDVLMRRRMSAIYIRGPFMVSSPEREVDEMVKSKATWQRLHLKQSTERSAFHGTRFTA